MAKKKQTLKGVPKDINKLLVQKSNPLYSLWKSKLSLSEFKILDVYLSRIDSHHPEKRTVVFEKGELENILGVTKINRDDLDKRLDHLLGNVVTLQDGRYTRGFHKVTLFEESEAQPDEDGLWKINLSCTQKAMEYFFNTEKLGYLRYRLRSITSLTSRYSYILFCYLEKNRYRKSWEISLDELKELLGCQDESLYSQYKFFNQRILKKAHKELTEKTECRFTYEPVKKGRRVEKIRFTVETLADLEPDDDPNQITIEQWQESVSKQDAYTKACENEFSAAEMAEITAVLESIPEARLPQGDGLEARRAAYLRSQYLKMQKYGEKHAIRSRQAYLVKMLSKEAAKKDVAGEAAKPKQDKFNNFEQRKYDYGELEKRLVKKQIQEIQEN